MPAFIGLYTVPEAGVELITISGLAALNMSVAESTLADSDPGFHNPSFATVSVQNFSLLSGSINQIGVDWREQRTAISSVDGDYDDYDGKSGFQWNSGVLQPVDYSTATVSGLWSTIVPGIPTQEGEGKFHSFRTTFLNGSSTQGLFNSSDATIVSGTAAWVSGVYTFTRTAGLWTADQHNGRLVKFYKDNTFKFSGVTYDTLTGALKVYFPEDPGAASNFNVTINSAVVPHHPYIYEVGLDGKGVEFNGISDLAEWAAVTNAKVSIDGSAVETGEISTTSLSLQWDNMYGHAESASTQLADGSTATVTNAQWTNVVAYGVFLFISNTGDGPVNSYPVGSVSSTSTADGRDDNGQWFFVDEFEAVRSDTPATIEVSIDVPAGKDVAAWVGAKTAQTTAKASKEAAKDAAAPKTTNIPKHTGLGKPDRTP